MKTLHELYKIFKAKFGDRCLDKTSGKTAKFCECYSPKFEKIKDYFCLENIHEDYTNGSFVVYYYVIEDKKGIIRFSDGCDYLNSEESWENNYGDKLFRDVVEKWQKKYKVNFCDKKYPLEMYVIYNDECFKELFENLVNCRINICCESHKVIKPNKNFSFNT